MEGGTAAALARAVYSRQALRQLGGEVVSDANSRGILFLTSFDCSL